MSIKVQDPITGQLVDIGSIIVQSALSTKPEETKIITPDFSSGNVVVTPTSGKVMTQVTINKDTNLSAENIKSGVTIFGITGTYSSAPQTVPYLTFQSPSSFTLQVYDNTKHWDGTLYYSTDTTTWNVWSGTSELSSVGNKLYLRGTGNTRITYSSEHRWVLTGSNIECIGNIENLLDWETVALGNHPTMANYCFQSLFQDCTSLTTAPALPATTLVDSCYYGMFKGCSSLTTAPALPATTLANWCYASMFQDCTSLTTAPALPATVLADFCYNRMFDGCTAFKVSDTPTETYQYAWRIPTSGPGTAATNWNLYMLSGTGGTFTSNPTINTTYYVEHQPV